MDTTRLLTQDIADALLDAPVPLHASECPVEKWLAFLGHRWNALILWHLKQGPLRHSQLAELLVGVTPKVLTERLCALEGAGVISRRLGPGFPRTTTYALTDRGMSLGTILDALEAWAKAGLQHETII
jgi:DNA-binding HxlR family transcriptional regulator